MICSGNVSKDILLRGNSLWAGPYSRVVKKVTGSREARLIITMMIDDNESAGRKSAERNNETREWTA